MLVVHLYEIKTKALGLIFWPKDNLKRKQNGKGFTFDMSLL